MRNCTVKKISENRWEIFEDAFWLKSKTIEDEDLTALFRSEKECFDYIKENKTKYYTVLTTLYFCVKDEDGEWNIHTRANSKDYMFRNYFNSDDTIFSINQLTTDDLMNSKDINITRKDYDDEVVLEGFCSATNRPLFYKNFKNCYYDYEYEDKVIQIFK